MLRNNFLRCVLCTIWLLILLHILLNMRCTNCIVNLENRIARIVWLVLRWHYWNTIISLLLQSLSLALITWMRRALIKMLVVHLLTRWFDRHNWIKSRDITSLRNVFVSSELLFWAFASRLWVHIWIRSAWRMVYITSSINVLQLSIRG